jgi:hypothetical protein
MDLLKSTPKSPTIEKLTKLAANVADTRPYALDRSSIVVTSATYANTTEKVTANTPDIEIIAKNHLCVSK